MKMFVDVPEVYLYSQFVDFRKPINGLTAIVEAALELPNSNVLAQVVRHILRKVTYLMKPKLSLMLSPKLQKV